MCSHAQAEFQERRAALHEDNKWLGCDFRKMCLFQIQKINETFVWHAVVHKFFPGMQEMKGLLRGETAMPRIPFCNFAMNQGAHLGGAVFRKDGLEARHGQNHVLDSIFVGI